jgi:hypothetical protein
MQVEIFDQREVDGEMKVECNEEALALIAELGLKGQVTENKKRICYPTPNREQILALEGLFPAATLVQDYAADCIPIRVLKEIRTYREENPNHVLVVRHAAPAILKDPVLIAYCNEGNRNYDWYAKDRCGNGEWRDFRIIARWGDALQSWTKMAEKGLQAITQEYAQALTQINAQIEMQRAFFRAGGVVETARMMPSIHLATLVRN